MNDENDQGSSKKTVTRKKLVDLKAVAALLDDGEEEKRAPSSRQEKPLFAPNEELIQQTARIKSQRDLILTRVKKMEDSKNRVSKNVFDKVNRDYNLQLTSISDLLSEKKGALNKELKKLYTFRETQTVEINRHKEILEEARFRHFLDEFSEEQFREVEEYETKEISHLQKDLAQVNSYIKVHEELFDPKDLGLTAARTRTEETKTIFPPSSRPPPQKEPPLKMDDFSEKTPLPELMHEEKSEEIPSEPITDHMKLSGEIEAGDLAPLEADDKAYFKADEKAKEPASIRDVYEPSPESPSYVSSVTPTQISSRASPTEAPAHATYKLVVAEGEENLDVGEYILKDNTSIGRSPSNDLVLKAAKVSRQHAAINKYKDQHVLIDLKSSNGVYINGKKVDEQILQEGDEISIGGYKMIFQKV